MPCSKPSISWRSVTRHATALVAAASRFFTGLGNTQIIMRINVVGLIANAVFDYVLIFGKFGFPAMGVAGAGYATALGTRRRLLWAVPGVSEKTRRASTRCAFGLAV